MVEGFRDEILKQYGYNSKTIGNGWEDGLFTDKVPVHSECLLNDRTSTIIKLDRLKLDCLTTTAECNT